jgi:hypothetical protein
MAPQSVPVATSAVIVASAAQNVQYQIFNVGSQVAYISNNSGVTSTTGFPLTPNSFINWYNAYNYGASGTQNVYAICAAGGTTLNVTGDGS